jgi:hypothetical protein
MNESDIRATVLRIVAGIAPEADAVESRRLISAPMTPAPEGPTAQQDAHFDRRWMSGVALCTALGLASVADCRRGKPSRVRVRQGLGALLARPASHLRPYSSPCANTGH